MLKKILLALALVMVVIQFIRPAKNISGVNTHAISTRYEVPGDVAALLADACNDCHSNKTRYPWYANVQPAAWWLANHVSEGKEHLNLSAFTSQKTATQYHQFEEIAETVKENVMPLPSYTWLGLHPEAKLTTGQRQALASWAEAQMSLLRSTFPADSLRRN